MTVTPITLPLLDVAITSHADVLRARRDTARIAVGVGIGHDDATRLAAAICEIAHHAHQRASARVRFLIERRSGRGQWLMARIIGGPAAMSDFDTVHADADTEPTMSDFDVMRADSVVGPKVDAVTAVATQIVAHFNVYRANGGDIVFEVGHPLPACAQPFDLVDAARVAAALSEEAAVDEVAEAMRQNRELLWALSAHRRSETQVERLNSELEATNRGVMALYAELDDRAQDLKRVSEHKSRFLSDVSHELRAPMTSVLNLTRLLLDHADGPLTEEQERQVTLIRHSVQTVTELVNDLLDIARIESGHGTLRHRRFTVGELFAALRGICRPLLTSDAVNLVFDDEEAGTELGTDDARLAQVLRNLLSNAIKFTERGEIRVRARVEVGDMIRFDVRDTGIGIAPEDQERIFDEFTQIDSHLQRRVHGSGLGLRLSRNLATLLGGRIELVSAPGRGSTFSVIIPRRHASWTLQSAPNEAAPREVTVP